MRLVLKLIAALLFGAISFVAFAPIAGLIIPAINAGPEKGIFLGLIVAAIAILICLIAPSGQKAWGRGSLIAGVLLVISPIAAKRQLNPLSQELQTAADELLSRAPAAEQSTAFTITSIEVVPTVSTPGTAFIIIGAIFIIFGLIMEFTNRRTSA